MKVCKRNPTVEHLSALSKSGKQYFRADGHYPPGRVRLANAPWGLAYDYTSDDGTSYQIPVSGVPPWCGEDWAWYRLDGSSRNGEPRGAEETGPGTSNTLIGRARL